MTVHIITFEHDREIAWNLGPDIPYPHFYGYRLESRPNGVTDVTSYYDWSKVTGDIKERFPIVSPRRCVLPWASWRGRPARASKPDRLDTKAGRHPSTRLKSAAS